MQTRVTARDERFKVSFSVTLMWQEKSGAVRQIGGRCVDLSSAGMRVEVIDRPDVGVTVLVSSAEFGRMGHGTVRYCRRDKMRCLLGIRFGAAIALSDPGRRKILERVLRPAGPAPPIPAP